MATSEAKSSLHDVLDKLSLPTEEELRDRLAQNLRDRRLIRQLLKIADSKQRAKGGRGGQHDEN